MEILLTLFDFVLDLLTRGKWSEYQGDQRTAYYVEQ